MEHFINTLVNNKTKDSYRKIIVIGCPGSGKSVLSRQMAAILQIPLYHLDMIWHKANKTTISKEEFDSQLNEILATDSWLIDGNFQRTLEWRIQAANVIVLLDMPTDVCLQNAYNRVGKSRPDIPWIEEVMDPKFEMDIRQFKNIKLPKIYDLLNRYQDGSKIIFVLHNRKEMDELLNQLKFNDRKE